MVDGHARHHERRRLAMGRKTMSIFIGRRRDAYGRHKWTVAIVQLWHLRRGCDGLH
jgi:hypothetical protein